MDKIDNITVVELDGELDSNTAALVQDQLMTAASQTGKILLDMSKVTYMSSAGLRLLLLLYRQIREQVGNIAIVGLTEEVKDVMSITGFLDFFAIYDTRNAGLKAMR